MDAILPLEAVALAASVNLSYSSDNQPGYQRRRHGKGFVFTDAQGARITDTVFRYRIKHLNIPPAWSNVWICSDASGHIQAIGRDNKGRKQYIYHPNWDAIRDQTKFNRLLLLAEALPALRTQVKSDLQRRNLSREKVAAIVVSLLDKTGIRIGNQEYTRQNETYGLTTLQDQHVDIVGATITFSFRGKRGVEHVVEMHNKQLARLVKQCQELPGQELFQYRDEAGEWRLLRSNEVNDYLRTVSGQYFTAKDFRTWGGTVAAATFLLQQGVAESKTEEKKNLLAAVKYASQLLGNTTTVCRKYYLHPAVFEAYIDGSLFTTLEQTKAQASALLTELSLEERNVLSLLRRQAAAR